MMSCDLIMSPRVRAFFRVDSTVPCLVADSVRNWGDASGQIDYSLLMLIGPHSINEWDCQSLPKYDARKPGLAASSSSSDDCLSIASGTRVQIACWAELPPWELYWHSLLQLASLEQVLL